MRYRNALVCLIVTIGLTSCESSDVTREPEDQVEAPDESEGKLDLDGALALEPAAVAPSYQTMRRDAMGAQGFLPPGYNTEEYARIYENAYQRTLDHPLSTFSIDVDGASYSNVRRFLSDGHIPPKDAVRIEELVNYFSYDYPTPDGDVPFSITTEVGTAPWNAAHQLVHVGLQGRRLPDGERPASNLVFLLDVSGSMDMPDKLPLLKQAFGLLVDQLTEDDRVAIVVYAGASGLVLDATPGSEKTAIRDALSRLEAGGSTAGEAGIRLAYMVAADNFIEGGNNRVILATDGDFNVGVSSTSDLVRLIEQKRDDGVALTVLGFGTGNLKDARMEQLADKGNGGYYYVDSELEARKVLVSELGGTLFTIARDVKIQVEFNPAAVYAYRLIGYENRLLADEDFNDDQKDAGELGAGHTVTALYEVVPVGAETSVTIPDVDSLRYQVTHVDPGAATTGELMTLKLRYKAPDGETSRLLTRAVRADDPAVTPSNNFYFSSAVAAFGMLLRESPYVGHTTVPDVLALASRSLGADREGYRKGFVQMVRTYGEILKRDETVMR